MASLLTREISAEIRKREEFFKIVARKSDTRIPLQKSKRFKSTYKEYKKKKKFVIKGGLVGWNSSD